MRDDDRTYRELIDTLVEECRAGQGQIGPRRAMAGIWNANANATDLPEQHDVNSLLARLSLADRTTLARLLAEEFSAGVHAALVALYEARIPPFDRAYEGSPFHDFVGRLDGWQWPAAAERQP